MNRNYIDGVERDIEYFVGTEVENLKTRGMRTLFVATLDLNIDKIISKAEKHEVRSIYLGANHCLKGHDIQKFIDVMSHAVTLMGEGYNVVVDIDPFQAEFLTFIEPDTLHNPLLHIMVSVTLAYADVPKNLYIKIDDVDFKASNSGVWVASREEFGYNDWNVYGNDKVLND